MSLFDRFSFRFGIFIYTGFNYCKPEEIQIRIKSLRSLLYMGEVTHIFCMISLVVLIPQREWHPEGGGQL